MWLKKMSGEFMAFAVEASKPLVAEKVAMYQNIHEYLISMVRDILGSFPDEYARMQEYMWYAERMWQTVYSYKGKALQKLADALFVYYYMRGLREQPLRNIAESLGVTISGWDKILGELGLSEEIVYKGTKRALKETLEHVETDVTDIDLEYDANGNLVKVLLTDKVTGKKKQLTLTYDAQGNLVKISQEWV